MAKLSTPERDDRELWDTWMAAFQFQALATADDLGIFTLLHRRPLSSEAVAVHLSLPTRITEQLLAVLAGLGLLTQEGGYFALAGQARAYLLPGSPFYWGPMLAYFREVSVDFNTMRTAVQQRPAPPVPDQGSSAGVEAAAAFTRAMHSLSFPAAAAVAQRNEFATVQRLLDVGGGSGSYCIALALRYPDMHFTVMDADEVGPTTRQFIADYGVQEQVTFSGFDMFSRPWPPSYDAHFFSNVFHDFDGATCARLASNSYEALPPGGHIFVHEVLLADAKDGPLTPATFALAMTYFNGHGGQYNAAEIGEFLVGAGFEGVTSSPTFGYYSLTSGRKP